MRRRSWPARRRFPASQSRFWPGLRITNRSVLNGFSGSLRQRIISVLRLTGEAKAELGDYSGAHLINMHKKEYDPELLKLLGLEDVRDALPPLCESAKVCGYVTKEAAEKNWLKEGTPVAGGFFDLDACMLAADVLTEDKICMIAGTWSVALYISRTPVTEKGF